MDSKSHKFVLFLRNGGYPSCWREGFNRIPVPPWARWAGSWENLERPAEVKTIIRAHKDIAYDDVVKVMGLLQAAKVTDISVAVK